MSLFQVFNQTSHATISDHPTESEAHKEADRLRRYHNTEHFQVRSSSYPYEPSYSNAHEPTLTSNDLLETLVIAETFSSVIDSSPSTDTYSTNDSSDFGGFSGGDSGGGGVSGDF